MKNQKRGIFLLVLVTILWSYGFVGTQIAIDANLKAPAILSLRFLIASGLIALFNIKRLKFIPKSTLISGSLAGVILFIAYFTQTVGQGGVSISLVALIGASYVVFVPLINWVLKGQKPSLYVMVLTVVTVIGMTILNWDGNGFKFSWMALLVFISALAFAMHVSFIDIYCAESHVLDQTLMQVFVAGILATIAMLFTNTVPTLEELKVGLLGILYISVFASAVCLALQVAGQKDVPATNSAIILSMEGLFACIFSILLGYEGFRVTMAIGGSLILLSAVAVNLRLSK